MLLVSQEVVWVVVAVVVDVVVVAMVAAAVESSFFFCASRSFCQARFMDTRADADPSMRLFFKTTKSTKRASRPVHGEKEAAKKNTMVRSISLERRLF